jgi:CRISPR-associated protein Csb1
MFEKLMSAQRLLMEVELRPVQGDRFQPTGFADLGAAVYERPDGMRMLLVESAQSMANRLEHGCLAGDGPRIAPELEGLPYIVAELSGDAQAETSSLIEAHRINSPYIISDKGFQKAFVEKAGYAKGKPLDWGKIAGALFHYDPNTLLHGVFLANLEDGRVKVPRTLTAFIEAEDVREAASGGVKNNPIDPSGKIRAEAEPGNVYGNVPYHRMEYTARKMTAYFNMDLASITGYGLAPEANELIVALGLYKMRHFLDGELRLRTACDLCPKGAEKIVSPAGFALPQKPELLAAVQKGIKACAGKGLFAKPPVTVIKTKVKAQSEGAGRKAQAAGDDGDESA